MSSLALLAISKLGLKGFEKLKEKAKSKLLDLVKDKLGNLGVNSKEDLEKKLSPEKYIELRKSILESEASLRKEELNYLANTQDYTTKTWKDEMTSILSWILVFTVLALSLFAVDKVGVFVDSLAQLLKTGFGVVFITMALENLGCRHILTKIADALVKKFI